MGSPCFMKAKSMFFGKRVFPERLLGAGAALFLGTAWFLSGSFAEDPQQMGDEEEVAKPVTRGMDERVSLDLRSTEVTDALKYLATRGSLNIAISKNVSGRVNLFLTDIPIHVVFDLILRSNELAYDVKGGVYNVMTETEYRAFYGKKFADMRKVETFRLKYAIPQQAFNMMDTLKSEVGRLLVDEDSGTVLVMDTPERLQEMEKALATLEQSGTIRVFDLKYAKAKEVEEKLKDQLEVNKLGFARADVRSNQIIVKTLPDRMNEVEKLVEALDRKTREVLIDAKIVKVTLTDSLDTGIDWNTVFTNLKFHGIQKAPGADFRSATTGTAPSEVSAVTKVGFPSEIFGQVNMGKLLFGTIARDGYELFRYLETIGETKLISNPRLLVTENQEAKIHVGTREAYVTSTTTQAQTTSTTAEQIQFIDVGIQLAVTPTINEDGYVTMKIKPEVSSVVRTLTTAQKNAIPIVDTSTAETNVMVKDGSTLVIGGLRKDQRKFSNDEVPFLAKIPLLGELFRQRDRDNELTELVVFITPHVVEGDFLVTGDEEAFGGGIKPYREYGPILDDFSPIIPSPPSQENAALAPQSTEWSAAPSKLRLREQLRDRPGVR